MNWKTVWRLTGALLGMVVLLGWGEALALTPLNGALTAEQACEAYVSKNKRTNPDQTRLVQGQSYPVMAANRAKDFNWLQVRVAKANPQIRWVPTSCGKLETRDGQPLKKELPQPASACPDCTQPNQADNHVLALSWQPAFCLSENGQKEPECRGETASAPQATRFTLHGLWPNRKQCCEQYGFCGSIHEELPREIDGKDIPSWKCQYPPTPISDPVVEKLGAVMPSVPNKSCLDRHEWFKHGVCTGMTADQYFELAIKLTHAFNDAGIADFMARNLGQTVTEEDFLAAVDHGLGEGASQRLKLSCRDGKLSEVHISLPKALSPEKPLGELIAAARLEYKSTCNRRFQVVKTGP